MNKMLKRAPLFKSERKGKAKQGELPNFLKEKDKTATKNICYEVGSAFDYFNRRIFPMA